MTGEEEEGVDADVVDVDVIVVVIVVVLVAVVVIVVVAAEVMVVAIVPPLLPDRAAISDALRHSRGSVRTGKRASKARLRPKAFFISN